METVPLKNREYIAEFLNGDELFDKTELFRLSALPRDDQLFLEQHWANSTVKRRRQIVSNLVKLASAEFRLDFGNIFLFCLDDPDQKIRVDAIEGLSEEENFRYIPRLVKLFSKDNSEEVRIAAGTALGKFTVLAETGKLTQHFYDEVYSALLSVLENKKEPSPLRGITLEAIAPLNLPKVKGLIEENYHSSDRILKMAAIHAMGINCHPMWLTALLDELKNPDEEIRYEAVKACGEIGEDTAVHGLLALLSDKSPRIRETAIRSLGEIGSDEAREHLNELLNSADQKIRNAARQAIKELDCFQELPVKGL